MSSNTTRFLLLLTATPKPLHHHRCPSLLRLSCHRHHLLPPSLCSLSQRRHYHPLLRSSLHRSFTHSLKPIASHQELHTQTAAVSFAGSSFSSSPPAVFHPWPEWSNLIQNLYSAGYFNRQGFYIGIDGLVAGVSLPEDFLRAAAACLAFAGDRPGMLGMLSRRDIEVVVANGTPFLFENADDSARRLKLFLDGGDSCVLSSDRLHTVDLMKFILSYASSMVPSEKSNLWNKELVEQCVRNLLSELVQLSHNVPQPSMAGSVQNQFPDRYGQTQRPEGQNVEMKKGDWICPRCNFMNFARNVKCRECQEARPKRQLGGGEWECPQCDFFNYGRNMVCLRCDCKRPGERLVVSNSSSGLAYGNSAELDSRLAANEEKAQKWFSKMSQLDSTSDMNGSLADEDFPEIMPLRKGVNRFVVSTRKTPLERRLANAQYRRNVGDDCTLDGNDIRTMNDNKTINQTTSRRLDEILARKSVASTDNETSSGESAEIKTHSISNSALLHNGVTRGSNSKYVPSVSLPAGMFANEPVNVKMDVNEEVNTDVDIFASTFGEQKGAFSGSNELPLVEKPVRDEEKGQGKQTERWFKKVAELHNVTDLTSATSDDGFPEIMSLRKGENRFEVSNKNNRSLSSPKYNRRMATEPANNTNYVPSVPFPPDYFAKDNQQHNGADSTNGTLTEYSNSMSPEKLPENVDVAGTGVPDPPNLQEMRHQQQSAGNWSYRISGENLNERKMDASYGMAASGISTQNIVEPQRRSRGTWSSGYTSTQNTGAGTNLMGNPVQNFTNPQASRDDGSCGRSWKQKSTEVENLAATTTQSSENQSISNSWTGKSLEGSAVKEPDPLDMSEEAKAERWFRRVAQIKDISELSQIPDEDFPSIMPMRKGVNRFVVSKRKTPLERRLTSTQYRRNLPVVNSDPVKENDSS